MSGHSKWSQIKHQKGVTDARRGQAFTKLVREIAVAARQGGGDPDANPRLRLAVEKARSHNMPTENIERAIKRALGLGDEGQTTLEEVVYEGFGPGGIALLIHAVTDKRNRAVSEIRSVIERASGKMGQSGSVSWLFEQKGVLTLNESIKRAEELALLAIDLGADDFDISDSIVEIRCHPSQLETLRNALEKQGVKNITVELAMVPKTTVALDEKNAELGLRLLERLESLDDVQKVYTNANFPDVVVERYKAIA
ncbi:MAG: YebC/PmpR family DNA-binding transcriptional regulator [Chloroflexi bacterium]|nr:YebC/PmpR family DNA-binding transcriptional regulator [Chloroflexota bacterium]